VGNKAEWIILAIVWPVAIASRIFGTIRQGSADLEGCDHRAFWIQVILFQPLCIHTVEIVFIALQTLQGLSDQRFRGVLLLDGKTEKKLFDDDAFRYSQQCQQRGHRHSGAVAARGAMNIDRKSNIRSGQGGEHPVQPLPDIGQARVVFFQAVGDGLIDEANPRKPVRRVGAVAEIDDGPGIADLRQEFDRLDFSAPKKPVFLHQLGFGEVIDEFADIPEIYRAVFQSHFPTV